MNGIPLTQSEIDTIISLRKTGHSLPEIKNITKRGYGTVYRYIKNIVVPSKFHARLAIKQGGSRKRANIAWNAASNRAKTLISPRLSYRQRLCLLSGLYWGEGTKRELNLINSDPTLIKTFVSCLHDLGITNDQLRVNLGLYNGIDKQKAITFWSNILFVKPNQIGNTEILFGRKTGKHEFGMCRVRVAKSAQYFKLLISLINEIKKQF